MLCLGGACGRGCREKVLGGRARAVPLPPALGWAAWEEAWDGLQGGGEGGEGQEEPVRKAGVRK